MVSVLYIMRISHCSYLPALFGLVYKLDYFIKYREKRMMY